MKETQTKQMHEHAKALCRCLVVVADNKCILAEQCQHQPEPSILVCIVGCISGHVDKQATVRFMCADSEDSIDHKSQTVGTSVENGSDNKVECQITANRCLKWIVGKIVLVTLVYTERLQGQSNLKEWCNVCLSYDCNDNISPGLLKYMLLL